MSEVRGKCIHNITFQPFSIYLQQIIKIDGNLTKFWQKQFFTVFLRHRV